MEKILTEAISEFIGHLGATGKKPSFLDDSRRTLGLLSAGMDEKKLVSNIRTDRIDDFFYSDSVKQKHCKNNGTKPRAQSSIKKIRRITRQFFTWCVKQGYIEKSPIPEEEAKILEQVECHNCGSNQWLQKYKGKWICGKCMLRERFNKKTAAR